jgi:hypothetical protein
MPYCMQIPHVVTTSEMNDPVPPPHTHVRILVVRDATDETEESLLFCSSGEVPWDVCGQDIVDFYKLNDSQKRSAKVSVLTAARRPGWPTKEEIRHESAMRWPRTETLCDLALSVATPASLTNLPTMLSGKGLVLLVAVVLQTAGE